jgi:hypothetical protein
MKLGAQSSKLFAESLKLRARLFKLFAQSIAL